MLLIETRNKRDLKIDPYGIPTWLELMLEIPHSERHDRNKSSISYNF